MNVTQIGELLGEENTHLVNAIKTVIEESKKRHEVFISRYINDLQSCEGTEISEEMFCKTLIELQKLCGPLDMSLQQMGFAELVIRNWLTGNSAPLATLRKPILLGVAAYAFERYIPANILGVLTQYVSAQVQEGESTVLSVGSNPQELPLEQKFNDLEISRTLPARVLNGLVNGEFVVLGEILAASEMEMLRTPNFGWKSLRQLNEALKAVFGVGTGSLAGEKRARFVQMHEDRSKLTRKSGVAIVPRWETNDLKPEYKDLSYSDKLEKQQNDVKIYVEVVIDPELIEALTLAGIVSKTQLATAPAHIINSICSSNESWSPQLETILARDELRLRTPLPLFLADTVDVYRE